MSDNSISKFISKISSEYTGGGCIIDFVHLKNGLVLGINDELVCLYRSESEWFEGDASHNFNHIPAISFYEFDRVSDFGSEKPTIRSMRDWFATLKRDGVLYHIDDDPSDIIDSFGNPLFSKSDCEKLRKILDLFKAHYSWADIWECVPVDGGE